MKTSTRNCCCFIVASILIAIGVVLMAFFGLLPCLLTATEMVIHLIVCILLLLFILTSFTGCHCLRKLAWVLCQYGTCLIVALIIGITMGVLAAVNKGTWIDNGTNFLALSGISIPHFWLGVLLIMLFSVKLHWLPASGYVPFSEDPLQNLKTMLLPAAVLGTGLSATLMRHTRAAMIAVLKADYIRTARAKGLLPKKVIMKHALRNALVPIITLTTLLFGELLGGAVLSEQVFTIPGFGKMIVDSVFNRDYAVVQGVVMVVAVGFLLMNLLADVLYVLVNPRMRRA